MEGKGPLKTPPGRSFESYVFDLDGTLVRLPVPWDQVRAKLRESLGAEVPFSPLFGDLAELLKSSPGLRSEAFTLIDSFELDAVEGVEPVTGALELLGALAIRGRLALVTMQGKRAVEGVISRLGAGGIFSAVVTREDSLERSEQIGKAMKEMSAAPSKTLFVGDRLNDVIGGRRAGVAVAILGRKFEGADAPDLSFRSPVELMDFLAV
jgi:phosphoglycolate phosphatase